MKILSTKQIRELDAYTIKHEPIPSIDLMERACCAFCSWFTAHFDTRFTVGIICGSGNNGGDGLGIARMLLEWDYTVKVWVIEGAGSESIDFKTNLLRLKDKVLIQSISEPYDKGLFTGCDILIDAMFGSGLTRPVEGVCANVIGCMNQADAIRVAVDIPSGLMADAPSSGEIVKADYTVSFQLPKLAFFMAENQAYVGEWHVVDIGLSKTGLEQFHTNTWLLTQKYVAGLVKPQHKFDHKGKRGHALLIAGSYGKMGAAVLASRAALRAGIGLLTTHIPANGYTIIQTTVPEAMASVDPSHECFSALPETELYTAVGIGPGLGKDKKTVQALAAALEKITAPLVLDADALNIISENRELLALLKPGTVLTPHPKEFERLAGVSKNDFEETDRQKAFSKEHKVVVVLKGAHTTITSPEGEMFINNTGNPAMATGGSGDVLTGILTALLAQGYAAIDAARLGVWLHGLAGDEARRKSGSRGLIASDFIDCLPAAFSGLR
ncbi:MAG: NAD(P)H-hydrate dehydratase [Cyclobacteriaceae bacterium]|nr:NAD(P)H-hydrate dehydratase [Cyclobacteriaceae bacterium]